MVSSPTIPAWIRETSRPWVVLDWGVLRSLPAGSGLPGQFTAIMQDRVFNEALGTADPRAFVGKLSGILTHPDSRGRILVGRYWNDIAVEEATPRHVRPGSMSSVHIPLSDEIRQQQEKGEDPFSPAESWPDPSDLDDRKGRFVEMIRQFAAWMKERVPVAWKELQRGNPQHRKTVDQ